MSTLAKTCADGERGETPLPNGRVSSLWEKAGTAQTLPFLQCSGNPLQTNEKSGGSSNQKMWHSSQNRGANASSSNDSGKSEPSKPVMHAISISFAGPYESAESPFRLQHRAPPSTGTGRRHSASCFPSSSYRAGAAAAAPFASIPSMEKKQRAFRVSAALEPTRALTVKQRCTTSRRGEPRWSTRTCAPAASRPATSGSASASGLERAKTVSVITATASSTAPAAASVAPAAPTTTTAGEPCRTAVPATATVNASGTGLNATVQLPPPSVTHTRARTATPVSVGKGTNGVANTLKPWRSCAGISRCSPFHRNDGSDAHPKLSLQLTPSCTSLRVPAARLHDADIVSLASSAAATPRDAGSVESYRANAAPPPAAIGSDRSSLVLCAAVVPTLPRTQSAAVLPTRQLTTSAAQYSSKGMFCKGHPTPQQQKVHQEALNQERNLSIQRWLSRQDEPHERQQPRMQTYSCGSPEGQSTSPLGLQLPTAWVEEPCIPSFQADITEKVQRHVQEQLLHSAQGRSEVQVSLEDTIRLHKATMSNLGPLKSLRTELGATFELVLKHLQGAAEDARPPLRQRQDGVCTNGARQAKGSEAAEAVADVPLLPVSRSRGPWGDREEEYSHRSGGTSTGSGRCIRRCRSNSSASDSRSSSIRSWASITPKSGDCSCRSQHLPLQSPAEAGVAAGVSPGYCRIRSRRSKWKSGHKRRCHNQQHQCLTESVLQLHSSQGLPNRQLQQENEHTFWSEKKLQLQRQQRHLKEKTEEDRSRDPSCSVPVAVAVSSPSVGSCCLALPSKKGQIEEEEETRKRKQKTKKKKAGSDEIVQERQKSNSSATRTEPSSGPGQKLGAPEEECRLLHRLHHRLKKHLETRQETQHGEREGGDRDALVEGREESAEAGGRTTAQQQLCAAGARAAAESCCGCSQPLVPDRRGVPAVFLVPLTSLRAFVRKKSRSIRKLFTSAAAPTFVSSSAAPEAPSPTAAAALSAALAAASRQSRPSPPHTATGAGGFATAGSAGACAVEQPTSPDCSRQRSPVAVYPPRLQRGASVAYPAAAPARVATSPSGFAASHLPSTTTAQARAALPSPSVAATLSRTSSAVLPVATSAAASLSSSLPDSAALPVYPLSPAVAPSPAAGGRAFNAVTSSHGTAQLSPASELPPSCSSSSSVSSTSGCLSVRSTSSPAAAPPLLNNHPATAAGLSKPPFVPCEAGAAVSPPVLWLRHSLFASILIPSTQVRRSFLEMPHAQVAFPPLKNPSQIFAARQAQRYVRARVSSAAAEGRQQRQQQKKQQRERQLKQQEALQRGWRLQQHEDTTSGKEEEEAGLLSKTFSTYSGPTPLSFGEQLAANATVEDSTTSTAAQRPSLLVTTVPALSRPASSPPRALGSFAAKRIASVAGGRHFTAAAARPLARSVTATAAVAARPVTASGLSKTQAAVVPAAADPAASCFAVPAGDVSSAAAANVSSSTAVASPISRETVGAAAAGKDLYSSPASAAPVAVHLANVPAVHSSVCAGAVQQLSVPSGLREGKAGAAAPAQSKPTGPGATGSKSSIERKEAIASCGVSGNICEKLTRLEEPDPDVETVLLNFRELRPDAAAEDYLRDMRVVLRRILQGLSKKEGVWVAAVLELLMKSLISTLDGELLSHQQYISQLEQVLLDWQLQADHVEELQNRIDQLERLTESAKRIRQRSIAEHERVEAALTCRIHYLLSEVERLTPNEELVERTKDMMGSVEEALQQQGRESRKQRRLLKEVADAVCALTVEEGQHPDSLRSKATGRVVELPTGELLIRPYVVQSKGTLVKEEEVVRLGSSPPVHIRWLFFRRLFEKYAAAKPMLLRRKALLLEIEKAYDFFGERQARILNSSSCCSSNSSSSNSIKRARLRGGNAATAGGGGSLAAPATGAGGSCCASSSCINYGASLIHYWAECEAEARGLYSEGEKSMHRMLLSVEAVLSAALARGSRGSAGKGSRCAGKILERQLREICIFARFIGFCELSEYLPLPVLNVYLFVRQRCVAWQQQQQQHWWSRLKARQAAEKQQQQGKQQQQQMLQQILYATSTREVAAGAAAVARGAGGGTVAMPRRPETASVSAGRRKGKSEAAAAAAGAVDGDKSRGGRGDSKGHAGAAVSRGWMTVVRSPPDAAGTVSSGVVKQLSKKPSAASLCSSWANAAFASEVEEEGSSLCCSSDNEQQDGKREAADTATVAATAAAGGGEAEERVESHCVGITGTEAGKRTTIEYAVPPNAVAAAVGVAAAVEALRGLSPAGCWNLLHQAAQHFFTKRSQAQLHHEQQQQERQPLQRDTSGQQQQNDSEDQEEKKKPQQDAAEVKKRDPEEGQKQGTQQAGQQEGEVSKQQDDDGQQQQQKERMEDPSLEELLLDEEWRWRSLLLSLLQLRLVSHFPRLLEAKQKDACLQLKKDKTLQQICLCLSYSEADSILRSIGVNIEVAAWQRLLDPCRETTVKLQHFILATAESSTGSSRGSSNSSSSEVVGSGRGDKLHLTLLEGVFIDKTELLELVISTYLKEFRDKAAEPLEKLRHAAASKNPPSMRFTRSEFRALLKQIDPSVSVDACNSFFSECHSLREACTCNSEANSLAFSPLLVLQPTPQQEQPQQKEQQQRLEQPPAQPGEQRKPEQQEPQGEHPRETQVQSTSQLQASQPQTRQHKQLQQQQQQEQLQHQQRQRTLVESQADFLSEDDIPASIFAVAALSLGHFFSPKPIALTGLSPAVMNVRAENAVPGAKKRRNKKLAGALGNRPATAAPATNLRRPLRTTSTGSKSNKLTPLSSSARLGTH